MYKSQVIKLNSSVELFFIIVDKLNFYCHQSLSVHTHYHYILDSKLHKYTNVSSLDSNRW